MGLWAACLAGCKPAEEGSASSGVAPATKVADPLTSALVSRDELAARLHAILERAQDRLPNAGEAALKAELEKDAEWVRQKKEFDELTKTIDALRKSKCAGGGQVQGKISK